LQNDAAWASVTGRPGQWVTLAYRVPRKPSTPRIAIWRRLKRLGVAQILDGLVALPLATRMADAIASEYEAVAAEADAASELEPWLRKRTLARLRRELHRIRRRDFFPPPEREQAEAAVAQLAASLDEALQR
jgi:hypothetical protein